MQMLKDEIKDQFIESLKSHRINLDFNIIGKAFDYSFEAHKNQKRKSNEPFISHCIAVAKILDELHLDSLALSAGLIHDAVEDTGCKIDEVREKFGNEMALLVDGVTKISELKFESTEEEQAENYRKMLLHMAKDVRVILIKFADRLHNMRTLNYLEEKKRKLISLETLEIYAPLAHRLGMAKIKWELEDLAFKYLHPEIYKELMEKVAQKRGKREALIKNLSDTLMFKINEYNIQAQISGRPKHFYSIFRKMQRQNKPFEEIYDLLALRILTDTEEHCYQILGVVHSLLTPIHDRFRDYIAMPKSNMYQSLHTTVIGHQGEMVEVQIRTQVMHKTAEEGIAAHWRYKEGKTKIDKGDDQFIFLRQILEWQQEKTDPKEFMEYLKIDLFHDEIFIFTPKGDVKQLPQESTPVDFAFAIHTEVGVRCIGAKVNGHIVSLSTKLKNGDTVEIITSPSQNISRDWLSFVKTSKARSKIRQALRKEEFEQTIILGKQIFERESKKLRYTVKQDKRFHDEIHKLGFEQTEEFFESIGRGEISSLQLLRNLVPSKKFKKQSSGLGNIIKRAIEKRSAIKIQGLQNIMIKFAECCSPVPGDRITGYITRGRGITIHRLDCPNTFTLLKQEVERRIEVQWDVQEGDDFEVGVEIEAEDRKNLLLDITKIFSNMGIDLKKANVEAKDGIAFGQFLMSIKNLSQLKRVMYKIKKLKGILKVERARLKSEFKFDDD